MLYPVAIERGDEKSAFSAIFPDVEGCFSAGDTYEETLINAKEALEAHFELLADMEELPPISTSIDNHFTKPDFDGYLWALVDIDTESYMGGSVKKNVTLPKLLLKKIDNTVLGNSNYKDRSHFLQVAANKELQQNQC